MAQSGVLFRSILWRLELVRRVAEDKLQREEREREREREREGGGEGLRKLETIYDFVAQQSFRR